VVMVGVLREEVGACLLGFSFENNLCFTGPGSSSLALVCAFLGGLGVFGVWRCESHCVEPFPFDLFVV
jgi:hypothetical protein